MNVVLEMTVTSVEDRNIVLHTILQMIGRGGGMVTGKEVTVIVISPGEMASSLMIGNGWVIARNTMYSNHSMHASPLSKKRLDWTIHSMIYPSCSHSSGGCPVELTSYSIFVLLRNCLSNLSHRVSRFGRATSEVSSRIGVAISVE